jgi:hypothetical protein
VSTELFTSYSPKDFVGDCSLFRALFDVTTAFQELAIPQKKFPRSTDNLVVRIKITSIVNEIAAILELTNIIILLD